MKSEERSTVCSNSTRILGDRRVTHLLWPVCVFVLVLVASGLTGCAPRGDDLIRAAADGDSRLVRTLLSRGTDVNSEDENGFTALHHAAGEGYLPVIRLLLSHGAAPNTVADDGTTPMEAAVDDGNYDVVSALLAAGAKPDLGNGAPLRRAITSGNVRLIALLLKHGADPNRRSFKGATPLIVASNHYQTPNRRREVAELLLQSGANPNLAMRQGQAPVHLASLSGDLPLLRTLVEHGADVRARTKSGTTTLHYAAWSSLAGAGEVIQFLLRSGIDHGQAG